MKNCRRFRPDKEDGVAEVALSCLMSFSELCVGTIVLCSIVPLKVKLYLMTFAVTFSGSIRKQ